MYGWMYVCAQLDGVSLIVSTCRKHEKQESLVEQALTALAQLLSAPRSQVRLHPGTCTIPSSGWHTAPDRVCKSPEY